MRPHHLHSTVFFFLFFLKETVLKVLDRQQSSVFVVNILFYFLKVFYIHIKTQKYSRASMECIFVPLASVSYSLSLYVGGL